MPYPKELLDHIIQALDSSGFEELNYYDIKEKRVVFLSDDFNSYLDEDEEIDENKLPDWQKEELELAKEMKADPYRFVLIEPIPSYEKYNLMEEFASQQKNERLAELLWVALDGKGAFRRFKDVLLNYPEERQKWFDFEYEWMKKQAIEFLDEIYNTINHRDTENTE